MIKQVKKKPKTLALISQRAYARKIMYFCPYPVSFPQTKKNFIS